MTLCYLLNIYRCSDKVWCLHTISAGERPQAARLLRSWVRIPHLGNKLLVDAGKYLPTNTSSYPQTLESSTCDYYNTTKEIYLQHYTRHYMKMSDDLQALHTLCLERETMVPTG